MQTKLLDSEENVKLVSDAEQRLSMVFRRLQGPRRQLGGTGDSVLSLTHAFLGHALSELLLRVKLHTKHRECSGQ